MNYYQRTIRPELMNEILIPFYDRLKRKIFCSIAEIDTDIIDENKWNWICLPIIQGGLGIGNSLQNSFSAFTASTIETSPKMITSDNIHEVIDLKSSIIFFEQYGTILQVLNNNNNTKIQSKLNEICQNADHLLLLDSIDTSDKAWLTSTTDQHAGLWLTFLPKKECYKLSNAEMKSAIRSRFRIPLEFFHGGNIRCNCNSLIDQHGFHFGTSCNQEGIRNKNHDLLKFEINNMLKKCGYTTKLEESKIFHVIDPENDKRLDISILNAPGELHQKHTLDITIVSPYYASENLSVAKALTKNRKNEDSFQLKKNKYSKITTEANLGFTPICFEVTGSCHDESLKYIKKIIKSSAINNDCKEVHLLRYWMSVFSITIQKSVANGTLQRIRTLKDLKILPDEDSMFQEVRRNQFDFHNRRDDDSSE
jgi:hypothetical protein